VPPTTRLRRALTQVPSWAGWLALLSVVHLAIAALLPVLTDEAYHWNFAVHLAWGYYDHPPMIAWVIALGRLLFGDTPLGVRFGPLLCSIGMAAVLAVMARRAYGERAASWAVLLGFAQPMFFWVAPSATPDSPLLFFWALSMALTWKAIESGRLRWWLAAGVALGGAMLSKYPAVLLLPSVLGYLVFSKEHRRLLATPGPYLAAAVAFAAFLPVLHWNATHDWVSFRFQFARRMDKPSHFSPMNGAAFVLEQCGAYLALLTPLAVVSIVKALRRGVRSEERYLLWCTAVTFLAFLVQSTLHGVGSNWPMPAYLALTVGMAGAVTLGEGPAARFYARRGRLLVVVMAIVYVVGPPLAVAQVGRMRRVQPDLYAWDDVCREAKRLRAGMPERTFYLGLGRTFVAASQLAFHLRTADPVYAKNLLGDEGMQYDYWVDPASLEGWDAVVVMEEKDFDKGRWEDVRRHFRAVEPPRELRVPVPFHGEDLRFYLARAEHYLPP